MTQKPLTHWLFSDLPAKKYVEKAPPEAYRVCVGLNREEGREAETSIRGVLHRREFKPHLKRYERLMGTERVLRVK